MKYYFDWNTQKEINVVSSNYFESTALAGNTLCPDTAGRDEFLLTGVIPPAKRLAGSGRSNRYSVADMSGAIEAAPSIGIIIPNNLSEISFLIKTNIILDPGLLAASVSLDIATVSGMTTHIPLNRSDVRIDWQSRGTFVVTVPLM